MEPRDRQRPSGSRRRSGSCWACGDANSTMSWLPTRPAREGWERMQKGPLDGVRVIDLTTVVLGPYATQMLGDLGADVIKIEAPDGDACRWIGPRRNEGMGSYFAMLNRNKRSVLLDLKRPVAREALLRLVDGADVFVHNMRIGAAERLGLGYAALAARNSRLVYACASGFRKGSSKQEHPAFDDLIQ